MSPEQPYRIPYGARDMLSPLPWQDSERCAAANIFHGIVLNSMQHFPHAVPRVLMWESKCDVCQDGRNIRLSEGGIEQGDTALHEADGRAFDAWAFPYAVLPTYFHVLASGHRRRVSAFADMFKLDLGDLGIAFYRDKAVPFLFGDYGPTGKIGEASCFLCEQLGINNDPHNGGLQDIDAAQYANAMRHAGVVFLTFPQSRKVAGGKTQHTLLTLGQEAWALYHAVIAQAEEPTA